MLSDQILLVNAIPSLRSRFINYGLRATPASAQSKRRDRKEDRTQNDSTAGHLLKLLDKIRSIQVPHGSFEHFYIVSLLSSLLWICQILSRGSLLQTLCQAAKLENGSKEDMSMDQIVLSWSFLLLQGMRRLFESYLITNFSASRIWFVQWYLGIAFYVAIGIAVWIEGAGMFYQQYVAESSVCRCRNFNIIGYRNDLEHHVSVARSDLFSTIHADSVMHPYVPTRIRGTARLPHLFSISAKIYTTSAPTFPKHHLSTLHSGMCHLRFIGCHGSTGRRLGQQYIILCINIRSSQPRGDSFIKQRVVCAEIRKGKSRSQVETPASSILEFRYNKPHPTL